MNFGVRVTPSTLSLSTGPIALGPHGIYCQSDQVWHQVILEQQCWWETPNRW